MINVDTSTNVCVFERSACGHHLGLHFQQWADLDSYWRNFRSSAVEVGCQERFRMVRYLT